MDYPGCKGFVDDLISEASAEFSPAHTLRKNAQERLNKVCELVDALAEELDCESVDVSVNTSSKQLTIMVLCDDIILEERTHPFFELIKMLDSFAFSKCKEFLRIELNIDGLWERSSGQQKT